MKLSVAIYTATVQLAILYNVVFGEQTLHWFVDKDNKMMKSAIIPQEIEARKENRWLGILLFVDAVNFSIECAVRDFQNKADNWEIQSTLREEMIKGGNHTWSESQGDIEYASLARNIIVTPEDKGRQVSITVLLLTIQNLLQFCFIHINTK